MIQTAISIIFWPIMVTETSIDKHLAYQSLLKSVSTVGLVSSFCSYLVVFNNYGISYYTGSFL